MYSFCIQVYRNYTASIQKLYCRYTENPKEHPRGKRESFQHLFAFRIRNEERISTQDYTLFIITDGSILGMINLDRQAILNNLLNPIWRSA